MNSRELLEKGFFDRLTLGVVKTLEKRQGVCDVRLEQRPPVEKQALLSWEQKYSCLLPDDIKNFYQSTNGFRLRWNVKLNDSRVPVGHMAINALENVIRLGGGNTTSSNTGVPSLAEINDDTDDEGQDSSYPKFDHRSRIFELDPCDGYGKVCLVYNNTKPGIPAQSAEVWFMDRSFQWHFMSESFLGYYRLLLLHLGLPQWQFAFTDIGLSSQAKQWFHMYAPVRLDLIEGSMPATDEPPPSSSLLSSQLDAGKVFKGKPDKKKAGTGQAAKRKQPASSARSQGSLPGRNIGQPQTTKSAK